MLNISTESFQQEAEVDWTNILETASDDVLWDTFFQHDEAPLEHCETLGFEPVDFCPTENALDPAFINPSIKATLSSSAPSRTGESLQLEYQGDMEQFFTQWYIIMPVLDKEALLEQLESSGPVFDASLEALLAAL